MWRRWWGITRSMAVYHGQPSKHRRMVQFYRQFLAPGDIGFDIGAHVGSRVRAWRRLQCSVIAVEPQPDCQRVLRALFGRDPAVTIVPAAAGAETTRARLAISTATPTVSSLSSPWIRSMSHDSTFRRVHWDKSIEVDVVRLDDLIARHGEAAFCKIDVEGFEVDVLAGLSHPVPALSFEYLPSAHEQALTAIKHVQRLGRSSRPYRYNYSHLETMRLASDEWLDAEGIGALLRRYRATGRPGDIYARS